MRKQNSLLIRRYGSHSFKDALGRFKLNPLQTISSAFLLISPFLSWYVALFFVIAQIKNVRLLVDEYSTESTLLGISGGGNGIAISQNIATTAFYSSLLLVLGGLISLRYFKAGLTLSVLGLAAFVGVAYPMFGPISAVSTVGYVSPTTGLFVAAIGVVLGVVSLRFEKKPIAQLLRSIKTREGLTKLGVVVALISLALDGLDHTALGQFSDFVGIPPFELALHLGFIIGIPLLVILESSHWETKHANSITLLVIVVFGFIVGDGTYHFMQGEIYEFIGHGTTEIVLHSLTYYGMVASLLSRFFLNR